MNSVYFEDIFYVWKPPSLSLLRLRFYGRWLQVGFITQKVVFLQKFPTQLPSVLSYMCITQQTEEGTFVFPSVPGPLFANNELFCLNKNIFLIFRSLIEIIV